ncbi:proteasome activator pa28, REG alpha/beta subunit [Pluteus cervinus]|uniref:Proteasome activator pa28, REG alpha/beta subunit n=1 Tax=Pluteus cervinus TaxID=181527 RepID=A0ACD3BH03_9AGAR|nr:proteasome activator pa28, REG alpha/beta subunit [Pluteus cervinus]
MEKPISGQVESLRKELAAAGERIIYEIFPSKIIQLHKLVQNTSDLDSPVYKSEKLNGSPSDAHTTKKRKLEGEESEESSKARDSSPVPLRAMIDILHTIIKKEAEELIASIDEVKLWVSLSMPRIEDGDNFGVQVQEEIVSELHRAQESAYNLRDNTRQDFLARAKICSKIVKYPTVEDYPVNTLVYFSLARLTVTLNQRALLEHDDKYFYLAQRNVIDLRALYAVLTDLVQKNIDKIRKPKANNRTAMY